MPPEATRFLVDANLPFCISTFNSPEFVSALDIGIEQNDRAIWNYALNHGLTIISRDTDFFKLIEAFGPPPCLVWFRVHYQSIKETSRFMATHWPEVERLLIDFALVEIHSDELVASVPLGR